MLLYCSQRETVRAYHVCRQQWLIGLAYKIRLNDMQEGFPIFFYLEGSDTCPKARVALSRRPRRRFEHYQRTLGLGVAVRTRGLR